MIIKPTCSKNYVCIPNVLLNDNRLSIEARGMIAHLLSKPKNWNPRPKLLAKELSVGRKSLDRMLSEAMEAGYMARSADQTHRDDGSWGAYDYVVGMPDDVAAAIENLGVAFSAQRPETHALDARPLQERTNHKVQTQKSKIEKNLLSKGSPPSTSHLQACQDEYSDVSDMGKAAQAQGCKFVFEGSKPLNAWIEYRRAQRIPPPPLDQVMINGKRRRGAWLPQLYPPRCRNREPTT